MTEPDINPEAISEAVRSDDKEDRDADLAEELDRTTKLAEDLAVDDN